MGKKTRKQKGRLPPAANLIATAAYQRATASVSGKMAEPESLPDVREALRQKLAERDKARAALVEVEHLQQNNWIIAAAAAAAIAVPLHEEYGDNEPFTSITTLREMIILNKDDRHDFNEYILTKAYKVDPVQFVKRMKRWPRLRKYWPRLRRRICSYCGEETFDLSKPRLLVCGGCGQGRTVARYCSEDCQRAHWPEHRKKCPSIHLMPACVRPHYRKMPNAKAAREVADPANNDLKRLRGELEATEEALDAAKAALKKGIGERSSRHSGRGREWTSGGPGAAGRVAERARRVRGAGRGGRDLLQVTQGTLGKNILMYPGGGTRRNAWPAALT